MIVAMSCQAAAGSQTVLVECSRRPVYQSVVVLNVIEDLVQ
jgi:hypothetical protein